MEGDIVRTLIAAERDHGCALQLLEDALLAAAPIRMRRPFLTEASGLRSLLAERIEAGTNAAAFAVDLLTGCPVSTTNRSRRRLYSSRP